MAPKPTAKKPHLLQMGPFLGHEPLLADTAVTLAIPTAQGFTQAGDTAPSHQDFRILTVFQHLRHSQCWVLSAVQVSL